MVEMECAVFRRSDGVPCAMMQVRIPGQPRFEPKRVRMVTIGALARAHAARPLEPADARRLLVPLSELTPEGMDDLCHLHLRASDLFGTTPEPPRNYSTVEAVDWDSLVGAFGAREDEGPIVIVVSHEDPRPAAGESLARTLLWICPRDWRDFLGAEPESYDLGFRGVSPIEPWTPVAELEVHWDDGLPGFETAAALHVNGGGFASRLKSLVWVSRTRVRVLGGVPRDHGLLLVLMLRGSSAVSGPVGAPSLSCPGAEHAMGPAGGMEVPAGSLVVSLVEGGAANRATRAALRRFFAWALKGDDAATVLALARAPAGVAARALRASTLEDVLRASAPWFEGMPTETGGMPSQERALLRSMHRRRLAAQRLRLGVRELGPLDLVYE